MAYYENCLLGSLNLPKYISNKYESDAKFNYNLFVKDVHLAVNVLNKCSDLNSHPLEEQNEMDDFSKRIGLGFTGLADAIAMMGYKYGSQESVDFIEKFMKIKSKNEVLASIDLAADSECCEAMKNIEARQGFTNNSFFNTIFENDPDINRIKKDVLSFGTRNTAFATVPPAGTLSILANNCTSGIEPVFAFSYKRKNRIDNKEYNFIHKYACDWALENNFNGTIEDLQKRLNYDCDSNDVNWIDRIKIQSICQKYTDSSISSTLNLPSSSTPEDIYNIYIEAWKTGLKGITVFRSGCKDGVLSSNDKKEDKKQECFIPEIYKKELLDLERSRRHRAAWKNSQLYINVSIDDDDMPIEVFTKLPKEAGFDNDKNYNPMLWMERNSNWSLITRLISMALRYGISIEDVIKQCDKSSLSMVDAAGVLSRILKKYIKKEIDEESDESIGTECPECKQMTYVFEGGCVTCKNCGFSKCG